MRGLLRIHKASNRHDRIADDFMSFWMKKKIFLHIGHGKTGTSHLQSVLARSHEMLKLEKVLYPYHPGFRSAAKRHISVGNLPVVAKASGESPQWLEDRVVRIVKNHPQHNTYIFSSEFLFWHMQSFFERAPEYEQEFAFHVILCVRNPLDLLASAYQQSIKRHGYTRSFDSYLRECNYQCEHTLRASLIVDELEKRHISYTLLNYSASGCNIAREIVSAMGVEGATEEELSMDYIVNRSLDASELQLVAFVNSLFGNTAGSAVSDSLVNQHPNVKSSRPSCSLEAVERLKHNVQPSIEALNKYLKADAKLACGIIPISTLHEGILSLSQDQAKTASDALLECLQEKTMRPKPLDSSPSATERKIARLKTKLASIRSRHKALKQEKKKRRKSWGRGLLALIRV